MTKTVVINIVGLTERHIGIHTPFLYEWLKTGKLSYITPVLPAVTCAAQATYLTGKLPEAHGIVGNGWYFKELCEVKFWHQSNKLIQAPKIWEIAKEKDPSFTCANLFWWYNMYSSADYSVTPRPQYLADGRKLPDIYTTPTTLRDELQNDLGTFPLFDFWGPRTSIKSSKWIAEASKQVEEKYSPTLSLIYLPHLDYNLQRFGPGHASIKRDLAEIDTVFGDLVQFYESKGAQVLVLSEYGITEVNNPVHLNRVLRNEDYISIREEQGLELLDAGASKAFAVADHQVAHIYINDKSKKASIKSLIEKVKGVERVLDSSDKKHYGIDHARSGDLVVIADENTWFTYYYWLDDAKAPDFARIVDIHKKPGYDPVETFVNPKLKFIKARVALKLLKKKLGFRMLMDIIPLDANLVKGSHGRVPDLKLDWPVLISKNNPHHAIHSDIIAATDVFTILSQQLGLVSPGVKLVQAAMAN